MAPEDQPARQPPPLPKPARTWPGASLPARAGRRNGAAARNSRVSEARVADGTSRLARRAARARAAVRLRCPQRPRRGGMDVSPRVPRKPVALHARATDEVIAAEQSAECADHLRAGSLATMQVCAQLPLRYPNRP